MTRPTYDVADFTISGPDGASGFSGLWLDHNEVDGRFVPRPRFIQIEEPGTGSSGRRLPSDHRTTGVVFVYDNDSIGAEFADVTWSSQDYDATVRMEVVVTNDMHGYSGKGYRDAIVQVLENVREDQAAPVGGVFGSDWQGMTLVNIDRTPSRFTDQWRAYYDVAYESFGVI